VCFYDRIDFSIRRLTRVGGCPVNSSKFIITAPGISIRPRYNIGLGRLPITRRHIDNLADIA
jgi:hypothetical protein